MNICLIRLQSRSRRTYTAASTHLRKPYHHRRLCRSRGHYPAAQYQSPRGRNWRDGLSAARRGVCKCALALALFRTSPHPFICAVGRLTHTLYVWLERIRRWGGAPDILHRVPWRHPFVSERGQPEYCCACRKRARRQAV